MFLFFLAEPLKAHSSGFVGPFLVLEEVGVYLYTKRKGNY